MPSIASLSVVLLYEHLADRGHDPETVFGRPWPRSGDYNAERTTAQDWEKMLAIGARICAEPAFGVQVARRFDLNHLGLLGYLLRSCASTLEALQRAERFHVLISDMNPLQVRVERGEVVLCWPLRHGWGGQLWDEFGLASTVQLARLLTGVNDNPSRVEFVGPPPEDPQPYYDFFGPEVRFAQPAPLLAAPVDVLAAPLLEPDATLTDLLDREASMLMQRFQPQADELQSMRHQLLQLMVQGRARLGALAGRMNCSERTLQRRLRAQGTSFGDLLTTLRREVAAEHLANPQFTLADVASLLGYADQSVFTRAFRDWTGHTPGQWRESHRINTSAAAGRPS